ncbi:hypothetical protein Ocin01_17084 [Orchesella cincta]|uniref:Uncharacterized protein n=1 Tax=Orchesella cincta TaxID=48709 RepID=A0A1D2M9F1_ORCCI|nr:hypothetical protein Ocin01_17084 [Orchesella cincta]
MSLKLNTPTPIHTTIISTPLICSQILIHFVIHFNIMHEKHLLLVWILGLILLLNQTPPSHGSDYIEHPPRNISCFVCFRHITPECEGQLTNSSVNPEKHIMFTDLCHSCLIRHYWDSMKGTLSTVERICLVYSSHKIDDEDCYYDYDQPPGSREIVETCQCHKSGCNGGAITEIGGKGNINNFPKEIIYTLSGAQRIILDNPICTLVSGFFMLALGFIY